MENNIIDFSDPGIVVKETTVHLSDEKLKNALSRTYERAQQDMNSFKFYDHYGVFLSIASTLFISLMTSDFGAIGNIDQKTVTLLVWLICIVSGIVGLVCLAIWFSKKTHNKTSDRDIAVDQIIKEYINFKL